jgi:hypothetical protein
MKVDTPLSCESLAPTRARMQSKIVSSASRTRDKTTDLGHEGYDANLTNISTLATHIRPRYQEEFGGAAEEGHIVSDELNVVLHFHAGVASFFEDGRAGASGVHFGTYVGGGCVDGAVREADDYVEVGEDAGELFDHWAVGGCDANNFSN